MVGPDAVLDFWFGTLDESGNADDEHCKRWWKKDPAFDAEVKDRFGATHQALLDGQGQDWLDTAKGTIAYVIVLDQLSRNMYRGSGQMYSGDDLALAVTHKAIETGVDRQLPCDQRVFLYMPLMHAEDLDCQNLCVSQFEKLVAELGADPESRVAANVGYAIAHRKIIEDFGRFPHRNQLVGRPSTPEETTYLDEGGTTF